MFVELHVVLYWHSIGWYLLYHVVAYNSVLSIIVVYHIINPGTFGGIANTLNQMIFRSKRIHLDSLATQMDHSIPIGSPSAKHTIPTDAYYYDSTHKRLVPCTCVGLLFPQGIFSPLRRCFTLFNSPFSTRMTRLPSLCRSF